MNEPHCWMSLIFLTVFILLMLQKEMVSIKSWFLKRKEFPVLSRYEIPKWDERVGKRIRTKIVIWVSFCLNVIEIHTFKNLGEKDTVPILAAVLSGILKFFVCNNKHRFSIFMKVLCKSLFPFKQVMSPFKLQHFMKKQLLFNRHFRNSVAGIRSFQPITWQAPPQSFTISWPEVRAFRPFQTFSTAAQQRQVMAALYYF